MENYRLLQFQRQFVKVKGLTANKGEITLYSFLTMQPIWKQLHRVLTFFIFSYMIVLIFQMTKMQNYHQMNSKLF